MGPVASPWPFSFRHHAEIFSRQRRRFITIVIELASSPPHIHLIFDCLAGRHISQPSAFSFISITLSSFSYAAITPFHAISLPVFQRLILLTLSLITD